MEPTLTLAQVLLVVGCTYFLAVLITEMELLERIRDRFSVFCFAPPTVLGDPDDPDPYVSLTERRTDVSGLIGWPLWFAGHWATCAWCASVVVGFSVSAVVHGEWFWGWSWAMAATTCGCVAFVWFWLYRDFE